MSINNINDFLQTKAELILYAKEYMDELEANPIQSLTRKIIVECKEDLYEVKVRYEGKEINFVIPLNTIYRLVGKSDTKEEIEKRIDKYIEKNIYKCFLNSL